MAERPKLVRIGADMQRWCAEIENELAAWPDVATRPMFGLMGYYRGGVIFAAIPRTRALGTPSAILLKQTAVRRQGVTRSRTPGENWQALEMHSAGDIARALEHLSSAYDAAAPRTRRRRPPARR